MSLGIVYDYSGGFASPGLIAASGALGAVRYIGFPGNPKCTTAEELRAFDGEGLGMALVYESTVDQWRGGESVGTVAGYRARDHAHAVGFPDYRPIYVSIDQGIYTAIDYSLMESYVRAFRDAVGENAGVYGSFGVCDWCFDRKTVNYFWQTAAWSNGLLWPGRNLHQRKGPVANIGGVDCDISDVETEDWGQHNYAIRKEDDVILPATVDKENSFTIDVPVWARDVVVAAAGWGPPMAVSKLAFFGPPGDEGVNQLAVAYPGVFYVEAARPWIVGIPVGTVIAELTYAQASADGKNSFGLFGVR